MPCAMNRWSRLLIEPIANHIQLYTNIVGWLDIPVLCIFDALYEKSLFLYSNCPGEEAGESGIN